MSTEDRFDEYIRKTAPEYHAPPETPRETMWERIAAERRRARVVAPSFHPRRRIAWLSVAAAALLVIGIGIGVRLAPERAPVAPQIVQVEPGVPLAAAAAVPTAAYRMNMFYHLTRADVLLTQFRAGEFAPSDDGELEGWARKLLTDTRLLLESQATDNEEYRALLEDLEFVLVQIVHATGRRRDEERRWIAEGLDERSVVQRLRLLIPVLPGT